MPKLYAFPHLLLSPQSLWPEDGARIVVTWQKKHFPLLVDQRAAASPEAHWTSASGISFEAKLHGNRDSDMDTLKAGTSRAVTQLDSDAEWPTVVSLMNIFFTTAQPRPSQRGQPCEGLSVFKTGHSTFSLEPPAPKSAMSNQLASHGC